jgi:hypothetical protein
MATKVCLDCSGIRAVEQKSEFKIDIRVLNDSSIGLRSGEYDGRYIEGTSGHPLGLVTALVTGAGPT